MGEVDGAIAEIMIETLFEWPVGKAFGPIIRVGPGVSFFAPGLRIASTSRCHLPKQLSDNLLLEHFTQSLRSKTVPPNAPTMP